MEKKQAAADALEKAKTAQRAAGKMTGMTGKDMFEFGGELYAQDDEEEGGDDDWDISRMLARYVSTVPFRSQTRLSPGDPQREMGIDRGKYIGGKGDMCTDRRPILSIRTTTP